MFSNFKNIINYSKSNLSKKFGNVKVIRVVASVNGKIPLCIELSCHRIIGTNGLLTGYAGGFVAQEVVIGTQD